MSVEIKTVGCRQNQYESIILKNLIDKKLIFKDIDNAILINSCSVTSRAMRDTRKIINQAKREGKNIILTGCVIDKNIIEDKEIIYLSNNEKHKIVYKDANKYDPILSRPMISIETGCDKFCSYCIVPYLRGKPIIREFDKITDEISFLADKGFVEFVLTGTNIAMAGNLIRKILNWANKSYSDIRFRLSSMDPDYLKNNIDIYKKPNVVHTAHISMHYWNSIRYLQLEVI
jgi:threonylcarbamoyladenosine tRNA methylthiotransferase MtaB